MREIKNVESSVDVVLELEIGVDTVYIRSNISEFEKDGIMLKKYDEIQMSKDEYIEKIAKEKDVLQETVDILVISSL